MSKIYRIIALFAFFNVLNGAAFAVTDTAIIIEAIDDPLIGLAATQGTENLEKTRKSMGEMGGIVEYKLCIQSKNGKSMQGFYDGIKEEFEFNKDEISKEIKSFELVAQCPKEATATCTTEFQIEHYYTNNRRVLEDNESICRYSGTDSWTINELILRR